MCEQRAQRCGRRADQTRDPRCLAVRLEEAFAQVNQVALGEPFDGTTHVFDGDAHRGERIAAAHDGVVGDDAGVLQGKDVDGALQFVRGEHQRHRDAAVIPALGERETGVEIAEPQRPDQRARMDRGIALGTRVDDQRFQSIAEDAVEVACELIHRPLLGGSEMRHPVIIAGGLQSTVSMDLRRFTVGCFGGGTGLPSLLGGLKSNPWLSVNAVVTMFDSGGSSGVLRDELGVLPPGDVLKCALALARNEREARRVLLARLPTLEHARLGGHTGGNLLLSMMERYSGDFVAAVDGLRGLLGCAGRVWPVSVEQASVCAEYADGSRTRGEVAVDAAQVSGHGITRLWLEPEVRLHPAAAVAIPRFEAAIIGPGSFYTSLMPILLVRGASEAVRHVRGPIVLVTNLLTEGRGMAGFTEATAVRILGDTIGRPIDVIIVNTARPSGATLERYAQEHKAPLELGDVPEGCEVVSGAFWRGEIARHDRRRLAQAVWAILARRLL